MTTENIYFQTVRSQTAQVSDFTVLCNIDDISDEEFAKEYALFDKESHDWMDDSEEVFIENDGDISSENEETKKVALGKSFINSVGDEVFLETIKMKDYRRKYFKINLVFSIG